MKRQISVILVMIFIFSTTSESHSYFKSNSMIFVKSSYSLLNKEFKFNVSEEFQEKQKTDRGTKRQKYSQKQKLKINESKLIFPISISPSILDIDLEDNLTKTRLRAILKEEKVERPEFYAELIVKIAKGWELRKLMTAILPFETGGKLNQVSSMGAEGPWQVLPSSAKPYKPRNLQDPEENLIVAVKVVEGHIQDGQGRLWGHRGGIWWYNRDIKYGEKVHSLFERIGNIPRINFSVS